MATQEEFLRLQEELMKIQRQTKRSRTRAGIGFGLLLFAMLISFVYAFVQQVAAEKNAEEALRQHELAVNFQKMAEQNAEEARKQQDIATVQRKVTEEFATKLTEELAKCRSAKKK